ncbi:LysR substrate-binding domain-containing protein [Pseudomonas fluorescens]|uniref:PCP degradation transcriptional activation protein n=1 Tax=Pseudomonas fluorescens TaxID=294 RepID=A0A5E7DUW4_PSEFL|nr:LysR substrate-binding domain-containing protein [Pseudomonas fluorescens]VVO21393.1 PCP degradation transcriptional activation protein [Pseudomonas fluorescens]
MQPTFLATQLYTVFRYSLSEIERAIAQTSHVDPMQSTRCFRLALSDLGEIYLLPFILKLLQRVAPQVELEVIQVEVSRLDEWLSTGKIDAAICNRSFTPVQAQSDLIFNERYVCMIREDHPRIGEQLSLEQYLCEKHVVVSAATGHHFVEDRLRESGYERKISLRVPHFSGLPEVISNTDLLVTLPSRTAKLFTSHSRTRVVELPFNVPEIEVSMFWQEHGGDSTAQRWFCSALKTALLGV